MKVFAAAAAVLATASAFALADITPLPDSSLWAAVVAFFSSIQGGTAYTVIAALVELGVIFFRTSMGSKLSGAWTQVVLYGLSAIAYLIHGLASGTPFIAIVTNTVFTGLILNGGYELVKHLFPTLVPKA